MPGVITTGNHPKALWPGVKAWWGRQYDEHEVEYARLFDTDTSHQAFEEDVQVTGFGLAPVKEQGKGVNYDSETQGYVSRYTHVTYALGYIVTWEELNDNLYEVVSKRRAQALAFSMRQSKENVAANIYNYGFDTGTSHLGGDGAALLSRLHPTQAGYQYNKPANAVDISETAIEDMIILIGQATNDRGLKISLKPMSLIVPWTLWFESNRIMKSVLQNDTANNAVNVLKATNALPNGIVMNHYLTDVDAWFIRTNVPRGLIHYERNKIAFDQDNDFDTKNAKAAAIERYSFGWTDWRALYGSAGA